MSEHTPGPWAIEKCPKAQAATDGRDWPWLVNYNDGEYEGHLALVQTQNAEANALLIAAAPELFAALADFLTMFGADDDPRLIKLLNKTRAAITKAKGNTVRDNGGPQERHRCELHSQSGGHGEAVDVCFEDEDGKLWVENGEYASVVFYCPVCGYASRAKAKGEEQ